MYRWIALGRRYYSKQVSDRPSKPQTAPKSLTKVDDAKKIVDMVNFRMPKHGFVVPALLHAKKPHSPAQMVRTLNLQFSECVTFN